MHTSRTAAARRSRPCATPQILNFSIAYGKTKHGLSRDWNVSLEEAEETVNAWYSDRPEVKAWQSRQHEKAMATGRVRLSVPRAQAPKA